MANQPAWGFRQLTRDFREGRGTDAIVEEILQSLRDFKDGILRGSWAFDGFVFPPHFSVPAN